MASTLTTAATQPKAALATCDAAHGNQVGAPRGNFNAQRHGLRSSKLPKGCDRIGRDVNELRRALEDAVFNARGEVNTVDALLISSACEWEKHRRLAGRWLRVSFDDLSHADRLNYSRDAAKATTERNKVIEALKLDEQQPGEFSSGMVLLAASLADQPADQSTATAAGQRALTEVRPTLSPGTGNSVGKAAADVAASEPLAVVGSANEGAAA